MLAVGVVARAQMDVADPQTNASLSGVDSVGAGVAWVSGSDGTVLRTLDAGVHWQRCAVPPGAEKLDFRAVQAFDASAALVMASGKGALSKVYKTTDGCATWKLVFENPDAEGFFDAMRFVRGLVAAGQRNRCFGVIVGDPVRARFPLFLTYNCGDTWERQLKESPPPLPGEGLFAASNSALLVPEMGERAFVTGGSSGSREIRFFTGVEDGISGVPDRSNVLPGAREFRPFMREWRVSALSAKSAAASAGAFSLAQNEIGTRVIVGGDYLKPDSSEGTAWYQAPGWKGAQTPPHGYRSAVVYDARHKAWFAVGPNGADVSFDDGRNWKPVRGETARGWNAISLPFVVGAKGRIGIVRDEVFAR